MAVTLKTGDQLKVARVAAGLSQIKLAEIAETNKNVVSRYEAMETLPATATALRLSLALLSKGERFMRGGQLVVII